MITRYRFSNDTLGSDTNPTGLQHVSNVSTDESSFTIVSYESQSEVRGIIQKENLPDDLLEWHDHPTIAARFEPLEEGSYILIVTNITQTTFTNEQASVEPMSIEKYFEVITFIKKKNNLIAIVPKESLFFEDFIDEMTRSKKVLGKPEEVIGEALLSIYGHFRQYLEAIKTEIDHLDREARQTTQNKELFKLADVERQMIYLEHLLEIQGKTLDYFLGETDFKEKLGRNDLSYDVELYIRQTNRTVRIYRDLLETIGSLFASMMSNTLNHLMKFLESASLVIAVPTLIAGLWGMNTAGVPGAKEWYGFWMMTVIAMLFVIPTLIILKVRKYAK